MKRMLILHFPVESTITSIFADSGPPLQSAYLGAILKASGKGYDVLDLNIESIKRFGIKEHDNHLRRLYGESRNNITRFIKSVRADRLISYISFLKSRLLSVSKGFEFIAMSGDYFLAPFVCGILRTAYPEKKLIVGGAGAYSNMSIYLQRADYIILGSAERVLPKIMDEEFHGSVQIGNARIVSDDRMQSPPLQPDYSRIDLDSYLKIYSYMPLYLGISCGGTCHFCGYTKRKISSPRDLDDVGSEIRYFQNKHGIRNFSVIDSCINSDIEYLKRFCNIAKKHDILWVSLLKEVNLSKIDCRLLRESGCQMLSVGIETVSRKIQDRIGKRIDLTEMKRFISSAGKEGIKIRASFMFDLPGETLLDLLANIRYIKDSKIDFYKFIELMIIPNTQLALSPQDKFHVRYLDKGNIERIRSPSDWVSYYLKRLISEIYNRPSIKKHGRFMRDFLLR